MSTIGRHTADSNSSCSFRCVGKKSLNRRFISRWKLKTSLTGLKRTTAIAGFLLETRLIVIEMFMLFISDGRSDSGAPVVYRSPYSQQVCHARNLDFMRVPGWETGQDVVRVT